MSSISLKSLPPRPMSAPPRPMSVRARPASSPRAPEASRCASEGTERPNARPVPPPAPKTTAMNVGAVLSTVALAGLAVAAVLFPLALIAAVPVALCALAFFGVQFKRNAEAVEAAKAVAHEPKWPSGWEPEPLPLEVLHSGGTDEVQDSAARALQFLRRLEQPGVFAPDAIVGALARARGYNARMWIRAQEMDNGETMWASLDGDGYYFAVPGAQRTVNLVNDDSRLQEGAQGAAGAHYESLRLADGTAPHMERGSAGATATYTLLTAPDSSTAVVVPAAGGGDCLFHAWAAAEDYEGYNALDPEDADGQQARVNVLRKQAVVWARMLIEQGDETLRKELARAADSEVLLNWTLGAEALANARHCENDADVMHTCIVSAQAHLFEVNALLAPYQREARREVMVKLRETWQLQRRLGPSGRRAQG